MHNKTKTNTELPQTMSKDLTVLKLWIKKEISSKQYKLECFISICKMIVLIISFSLQRTKHPQDQLTLEKTPNNQD